MAFKNQDILDKLTLEEKVALCEGADFWHTKAAPQADIPAAMLTDGPHGLRKQSGESDMLGLNNSVPATCFPTAAATANSWDTSLLEEIGTAIGEEGLAEQVGVVLGPGVNIKRNPLCGRSFEYFSEDPLVAGKLGAAFVRGQQSTGVGASVKHFALNSQEYKRFSSDSVVDERTMRELYLAPFEAVVKEARPATVMCAYNKVNGEHCSDSKRLLTDILRDEWGFDGLVVTDWGATNDRVAGFQAGCDLMMPGGSAYGAADVLTAVKEGTLPESAVDACADRVLTLLKNIQITLAGSKPCDKDAHHALARRAAEKSAVLLKNDGVLPLRAGTSIALIGDMAKDLRYQGAGSSHICPTRLSQVVDQFPDDIFVQGCNKDGSTDGELLAEAAKTAAVVHTPVVFVGLPDTYESEGFDRKDMRLPDGHTQLIEAVAEANPNTVVVLLGGSVMELPWLDSVKAVLYMALPGQAGSEAIAALLKGETCPGGKLAETWPVCYEDVPSANYYAGTRKDALYKEGIYVGYRYYDTAGIPVRFPFGYGLSYTSFAYHNLEITADEVRVTVENTGKTAGDEIVQLYVAPPVGGLHRPVKELKGFVRVSLVPGERRTVSMPLTDRSFAVWDGGWVIPGGEYTIQVAASSADIRLEGKITKDGPAIHAPAWQTGSWYEHPKGEPPQIDWEKMLGRSYTEPVLAPGSFTMDNTPVEMAPFSPTVAGMVEQIRQEMMQGMGVTDENDPGFRMAFACSADCALRGMNISSQGSFPWEACLGLLGAANAGM